MRLMHSLHNNIPMNIIIARNMRWCVPLCFEHVYMLIYASLRVRMQLYACICAPMLFYEQYTFLTRFHTLLNTLDAYTQNEKFVRKLDRKTDRQINK